MVKDSGLSPDTKWQLIPNMKFTMDMFEPKTKQRLMGRAGGSSDLGMGIPKDKERHATQAALAQQQGGVRSEPVLLIKSANGYELLEGWHRTIQHFHKFPDGYTGPAYVAVAQGQQGVAEGVPQPGKSSGKPISWIDPTKVVTEYLTLDEIFKSVSGIPYYNNVVTDRDNKDFTWGVTKRVIQYAKELVIRPDAYKNWPPIIVLDGKLQDGAHRISTIYLMQQRVQPNNPIWKNAKLKVEFGTSDNVKQGVAEGFLDEASSDEAWELVGQPVPEIQQFVKQMGYGNNEQSVAKITAFIDKAQPSQIPSASIPKLKNLANKGTDVQTLKAVQQISGRPDAEQQYTKLMKARDAAEGRNRDVSGYLQYVKSGNYDPPVLLKLPTGIYVIGGRTRLYAALALGVPANVKIISANNFKQGVAEGVSNSMSTDDMIAYLRQHHDTNLHQDYLNHVNTFSKFVLKDIPTNTLKTDLPGLDREKVERYKKMDQSKAPPIVLGGKYILDGYHRANAIKELGIPTIKAYVGITTK
jgi:hypothetical protein